MTDPGGSGVPAAPPFLEEARRLYLEEGLSLVRVGSLFGITEPSMRRIFEAAGVPIRLRHSCIRMNGRYKPRREAKPGSQAATLAAAEPPPPIPGFSRPA